MHVLSYEMRSPCARCRPTAMLNCVMHYSFVFASIFCHDWIETPDDGFVGAAFAGPATSAVPATVPAITAAAAMRRSAEVVFIRGSLLRG
jgi:hypothetical protein